MEGRCWRGNGTIKDVEKMFLSIYPENGGSSEEMIANPGSIPERVMSHQYPKIPYIMSVEIDSELDSRTSWDTISALSGPAASNEGLTNTSRPNPPNLSLLPPRTPVGETTRTDDTFDVARWWLKYCLDRHAKCSTPCSHSRKPPTRLLEISDMGLTKSVRLSSYADRHRPVQYLALSHCWGKTEMFKLTSGNCSDLHVKISWDLLPKTFQDAIEITRCLGYEYIWIDSLCIMQDSKADWDREALNMASYYGNAVCTIAALGSKDGSGGCYKSRNPLRMQECIIQSSSGRSLHLQASRPMHYEFDSAMSPLHKRSWVVQERLLSPRTLYYGSTGIYWECRTSCAAEWDPEHIAVDFGDQGTKSDMDQRPVTASLKSLYSELQESPDTLERLRYFLSIWYTIVQTYTESFLTFPTDKLVALSGVVDALQERLNLSFYAGLWSKSRVMDLIWVVDLTKIRAGGYTIHPEGRLPIEMPTWSWISSPYPIYHPCKLFLEHKNSPSEHYNFTDLVRVEVGNGDLVETTIRPQRGMCCVLTLEHSLFKCRITSRDPSKIISYDMRTENGTWLANLTCDTLHLKGREEAWCVLIAKRVAYNEDLRHPWSCAYYGIALQPSDFEANTWSRVGCFSVYDTNLMAARDEVTASSDPIHSLNKIILI